MIYWQSRILSNVKKTLGNSCRNVVSTKVTTKSKFPAMLVRVISNASLADDLEESDGENAVRCVVTIEAYTKTTLQDATNLIEAANGAMYRMGFVRRQGPVELENAEAPDVFRVSARYLRTIGADDTIDAFE